MRAPGACQPSCGGCKSVLYRTSTQGLESYLSSVHWGASSSSCLDTKVPRFFLSEEKELKALWRSEQASLWPCHLWSWQRGHGTNGVKFQPCSDPLSSLYPHPLEPGCWVGPGLAPPHPHMGLPQDGNSQHPGALSPLPTPTDCLGAVQHQLDLPVCQLSTRLQMRLCFRALPQR